MTRRAAPAPGQLDLFGLDEPVPAPPKTGPRGFPLCGVCRAEGIGPDSPWCVNHWSPEADPAGGEIAMRLGLLPCTVCDGTGLRNGHFTVGSRRVQVFCDCIAGQASAAGKVPGGA